MTSVAISTDKRFHRAHVKPGRKRSGLRRVVWPIAKYGGIAAVLAAAISFGAAAISEAGLLRIDHIVVRGNGRMATASILSELVGLRGESIVRTDLGTWRTRLQSLPWIRDAVFRRSLPSTLEVVVSEREPIGIGRVNGRLYLVDDEGAVIDAYGPQYSDVDLPIIDGLAVDGAPDEARGALAARVIQSLRAKPAIAARLSQVVVSEAHNAAVIVDGDPALIYVGEDRFLARLESYLDLATALRQRVADIDYVDLRVDDRIYVRPTAKSPERAGEGDGARVAKAKTKARKR